MDVYEVSKRESWCNGDKRPEAAEVLSIMHEATSGPSAASLNRYLLSLGLANSPNPRPNKLKRVTEGQQRRGSIDLFNA